MAKTRVSALTGILAPWWAKVAFWLPLAASVYQFGCDQFGLPTLPVLWGMTGTLVPWWGWLLIAQGGFTYALFEYVRTRLLSDTPQPTQQSVSLVEDHALKSRLAAVEQNLERLTPHIPRLADIAARAEQDRVSSTLAALRGEIELIRRRADLAPKEDIQGQTAPARLGSQLYYRFLRSLGVSQVVFEEKKAEVEAEIKADAQFLNVLPEEVGRWASGQEKREWYLTRSSLTAAGAIADNLEHYRRISNG